MGAWHLTSMSSTSPAAILMDRRRWNIHGNPGELTINLMMMQCDDDHH